MNYRLTPAHLLSVHAGYGMTELSPVTHASKFENIKLGSVGMLLPNLECKVGEFFTSWSKGHGTLSISRPPDAVGVL